MSIDVWGQPDLFPLDGILLLEEGDFTSGHNKTFRIVSVSHALDAARNNYDMTIEGEVVPDGYEYDPVY